MDRSLRKKDDDKLHHASHRRLEGESLVYEGGRTKALTAFQQALDLCRRADGAKEEQGDRLLYDISSTLRAMGRYEEARTALQEALSLYRQVDNTQRRRPSA